jgi:predicted dinucleotide-binding enzyme
MLRKSLLAVAAAGAVVALAAPASAAATVCYDVYAEVNGEVVLDQGECIEA